MASALAAAFVTADGAAAFDVAELKEKIGSNKTIVIFSAINSQEERARL